ncbi:hypothetical protein JCM21531_3025 [Acetivibrio straminisolvens JCM 21531]|uniref:Uncharacterized protein n=1 Tax=Acetivibrio straminisolvens JCM 21531 TaxID=1294263 RepID=W4V9K7_9FIRM|nr:hypothetical protein JCM21531_3025 [Acetivibrio straminisolvens JCM 21531]
MLALVRCFLHALHYFTGKVLAVIFGHAFQDTFQDNRFGTVIQVFKDRYQPDAALLQMALIVCTVKAIPAEPVQFMDDHGLKHSCFCVLHHVQELRPLVRRGRLRFIGVYPYYVYSFPGSEIFYGPDLGVDRFFTLVVAAVSCVYYGIQWITPWLSIKGRNSGQDYFLE